MVVLTLMVSCGSKKKTTEITKEVYKEKKDYYLHQLDSLKQEIEYRNAIIQLSIEPVDPKIPNTAKFTRTETGFEYEGENSKVGAKSQKTDSTVVNRNNRTTTITDKGEVKETKKENNQYKEKQIQILWWQWIILIVGFLLIGAWVYFRTTGKRIKLPKLF